MDLWMFAVKRQFYRDNFSRLINCNVSGRIEENHKQENISSKIFKKYISFWLGSNEMGEMATFIYKCFTL